MAYDKLPAGATLRPSKFEAHTPQQEIDEFKQLLKLSKLGPETYENSGKDERYMGLTRQWLSDAKKYWETEYDWRKTESHINSFPNFTADIADDDGTTFKIHFVALFSDKKDAIPITFLHGWPGSFLEFLPILSLLKDKYSPSELPYHVVVPSLLGYGYSADSTPKNKDWKMIDTARILNKLMVGLGFGDGYASQGGDIGSYLTRILAVGHKECKAAHLNFCIMEKPKSVSESAVDEAEKIGLKRYEEFSTTGNAYAREHGTRPSTIGHVLGSNPLALLAWISEKFQTWTDTTPPLSTILDSVTLYWYTSSFARSIYPYREMRGAGHADPAAKIPADKMFGYSWFPYELAPMPRAWVETTGELTWFRQHESGGHFAALEKPDELLGDVEDFLKGWKGGKSVEGSKL